MQATAEGLFVYSTDNFTGYGPLIREYVFFLLAKLAFHRQHPEFNGGWSLGIWVRCANAEKGYLNMKSISA